MLKFSLIKFLKGLLWITAGFLLYLIADRLLKSRESCLNRVRLPVTSIGSTVQNEIPRIIHQTFSTGILPEKFKDWQESCKNLYPKWKYILWTDEALAQLVKSEYPWLEKRFNGYAHWINRVDMGRYMVLYKVFFH